MDAPHAVNVLPTGNGVRFPVLPLTQRSPGRGQELWGCYSPHCSDIPGSSNGKTHRSER
jgi:hypothetical protein